MFLQLLLSILALRCLTISFLLSFRLLKLLRIKLMDGCLSVLKIVPYLLLFGLSIGSFITVGIKRFLVTVLYSAKVQEVAYRGFDIKNLGGLPPYPPAGFSGTYTKQTAAAAENSVRINVPSQQIGTTSAAGSTALQVPPSPARPTPAHPPGSLPPLLASTHASSVSSSSSHPRQSSYTSSPHASMFLPSNYETTLPSPPPSPAVAVPASSTPTPAPIAIPSTTSSSSSSSSYAPQTPQNPKSLLGAVTPSTPGRLLESRITGLRSLFQILDSLSCTSDDHRSVNTDMRQATFFSCDCHHRWN